MKMRRIRLAWMVLFSTIGTVACGVDNGFGEGDEGRAEAEPTSSSLPLYYDSTGLWPKRDISVCWETSGYAAEKRWVKDALRGQRSWARTGDVNFVGWGDCAEGQMGVRIKVGTTMSSYLGYFGSLFATYMTLDFRSNVNDLYSRCLENSLDREQCIKSVALHEFGHALGYAHEHNRDDTPDSCTDSPQGGNGNNTFGAWDGRSLMAYCNFTTDISPVDRVGTHHVYGAFNGDTPRLMDYSGDGRADLYCHNAGNNSKQVDFADASGAFGGTDWSRSTAWCTHDVGRLYKGDFNGDGRGDLLCHDLANGNKWVDYADSNGGFDGTNWYRATTWCSAGEGRLYIGDFNGDNRDDLLCQESDTGKKYIDYADASGQFNGNDWSHNSTFCTEPTSRLFVGDFNGDGRSDLLCQTRASGTIQIDYADGSGRFGSSDWSMTSTFCKTTSSEMFIGDFNGDGRSDLLCHYGDPGIAIDYADASGRFARTEWARSVPFCSENADRLYVGDVNGDRRDDLVCHDVRTGNKRLDYADSAGKFNGVDWQATAPWCGETSAELH